jgi:hypothetical protein
MNECTEPGEIFLFGFEISERRIGQRRVAAAGRFFRLGMRAAQARIGEQLARQLVIGHQPGRIARQRADTMNRTLFLQMKEIALWTERVRLIQGEAKCLRHQTPTSY